MVARPREISRDPGTLGTQGREASQQGDKMSRNRILATGALLWTIAAADGIAHLASGDWMAAVLMGTAGVVCVGWVALRRRRGQSEAEAA